MELRDILQLESSWERLKNSERPVCIYGTGDACERILSEFDKRKITCSGIFASDGFVRNRSFAGFQVMSLTQAEQTFGSFTACIAFGSELEAVMSDMRSLAARHDTVMPDLPIAGDELFTREGLEMRLSQAEKVCSLLADSQSQEVFKTVLAFKLTGDIRLLDSVFSDHVKDLAELIAPKNNDIYADLGAYTGDTAGEFLSLSGGYRHIYAFEPDKRSFRKLTKNLLSYDNITLVNAAAWNSDGTVFFGQKGGRQSAVSSNGTVTAARRLDSILCGRECSVIKYDVEGAEKQAIDGSAETIKRFHPRLIVSAYHRPFDMTDLIFQILSLHDGYNIYLRQPPYYPAWDTVIYAV